MADDSSSWVTSDGVEHDESVVLIAKILMEDPLALCDCTSHFLRFSPRRCICSAIWLLYLRSGGEVLELDPHLCYRGRL